MKVWGHEKCGKLGIPRVFIWFANQSHKPMHPTFTKQNGYFTRVFSPSLYRSRSNIVDQPSRYKAENTENNATNRYPWGGRNQAFVCRCCHLRCPHHHHLLFWNSTCFERTVALEPIPPNTPTKLPATTTKNYYYCTTTTFPAFSLSWEQFLHTISSCTFT